MIRIYSPQRIFIGFAIVLLNLLPHTLYAAEVSAKLLVGQLQMLEDSTAVATFDQIWAQRARFTDLTAVVPDFGYSRSAFWLRIPVYNQKAVRGQFYLDLENATCDYVTLYIVHEGTIKEVVQSGDMIPGAARPYPAISLVLPFSLAANESTDLYLRMQSRTSLLMPLKFLDEPTILRLVTAEWMLHGILLGLFGALFLYNFFIWLVVRSPLYFYYVLYLPLTYLSAATITGFVGAYLTPYTTWPGNQGAAFISGLAFGLSMLIMREFLQTYAYRRLDRWLYGLAIFAFVEAVRSVFFLDAVRALNSTIMFFFYPLVGTAVALYAWRRGQREARFFVVSQISLWVTLILFSLMVRGILPYYKGVVNSLLFAAAIDALMRAFALGDRIRILQQARLAAEETARRNLEIHSEELERLVTERTTEIKTLQGILPICANCKKIRDDDGAWQQLEVYISHHTDAEFSHGICTECMQALYPEIYKKRQQTLVKR